MKKFYLDEREVIALYKQTGSTSKVAAHYGCHSEIIRRILIANNIPRHKRKEQKPKQTGFVLTKENEARIVALYKQFGLYGDVAKCVGCSTTTVRKVITEHGLNPGYGGTKRKITDEQLISECKVLTRKQIAEKYGMHIAGLDRRMHRLGIHAVYETESVSVKIAQDRESYVRNNTNGKFEFVEFICRHHYKIRCTSCGHEFNRNTDSIKNGSATCPNCGFSVKETHVVVKTRTEEEQLEKARKKLIRCLVDVTEIQKPKECHRCGKVFYSKYPTQKYCCKKCAKQVSKKDSCYDRVKDKSQIVDKDITLRRLHKRDNGICWICGEKTDWNDWKISENGNKYPGDNYPVRDHVIPLSRGGEHSWENVRLAHWKCNLDKSDVLYPFDPLPKDVVYSERMKSQKKKTAQYTLDGKLIKIWECTADIRRELGLNDKRIQSACRKDESTTGNAFGFHWEYVS